MVKRLALILAALSWISPLSVYALGLGSIDMRSTLNQRLDARIELLRVRQGELKGIDINLATEETFRRAGIERPEFLTKLDFSLVRPSSGGRPYIQITSATPITEPFLNFLVEVNWANGRLLREFTVLVDPPVLAEDKRSRSPSVQSPTVGRSSPPRQREVITSERPTKRSVPRSSRPDPDVTATGAGGVQYGPTKQGDTLWEIAARMRPQGSSITVPQMMMALLESNPGAFYGGNINNLKMGHVLRISDAGIAETISHNDASRMASMQWEEWKENRGMLGSTPSRTRSASSGRPTPRARLKLVSPEQGEAGDGTPRSVADGGDVAKLSEELALAQEALDATRRETSEMNERMAALNEQIETMKRLVSLKDNQLAALESQLRDAGQTPDAPAEAASDAAGETASVADAAPAEEAAATEGAINDQAEMDAILSGDGSASQEITQDSAAADQAKPDAQAKAQPKAQPQPAAAQDVAVADEGIMGMVMSLPSKIIAIITDYLYSVIAIVALIAIVAVVIAVSKRRKEQAFQESILTGQSSVGDQSDVETSEDASFMSDFAVSSMEGIATDVSDVDPVSEADVYMAYGRYKQAEELITTAINNHPDRSDLKLKALEIHYAAKDKDAFELNAEMYKGSLGEHWERVCEMGTELCPDNAMFTGDAPPASAPSSSSETVAMDAIDGMDDLGGDMDFDLGSDDSDSSGGLDDMGDLDFDLGMDDDSGAEAAVSDVASASADDGDNSLDFDLGDFETEESPEAASTATEQVDVVSEMSADDSAEEMSFDMDSGTDASASDDNSLDFDLGSFDTDDTPAAEEPVAEAEPAAEAEASMAMEEDNALDFDMGDMGLDEAPASDMASDDSDSSTEFTDADLDAELDESLFADVDEVGTKLDLARAYIDMGDSDGAKSILDEVMEEGDDSQKNEAEGLMQQMA